jgi:hypothetical protein
MTDAQRAKEWLASRDYLVMSSVPNRWYLVTLVDETHFTDAELIAFAREKGFEVDG